MKIVGLLLALITGAAATESVAHAHPAVQGEATTVLKTIEWPDFNGGTVEIEQRLVPSADGGLIYAYELQSNVTKLYHLALCEISGMQPSSGQSTTYGDGAGWTCERQGGPAPDEVILDVLEHEISGGAWNTSVTPPR